MGMAKRKYSKRSKIEPAVQTFYLATPSVSSGQIGKSYIDLSQVASLINRRFYRQGINWAVAGIKVMTAQPQPGQNLIGNVSIEKLPNTWVMSNAWEKGMRAWSKMNREALSETQSIRPKFLDFKIFADADHHAAGYGANLLPVSIGGVATPGEWMPSKYVVPLGSADPGDTEEFEVIGCGASYPGNAPGSTLNAVSLIEGYASSRGLPNVLDPNTPGDAADSQGVDPENWLQAIFNEGTDQSLEVIESMITENNIAPYPFENDGFHTDTMYPGGANQLSGMQIHDIASYGATTIGGTTRLKGGNFPCGLIKITHSVTAESTSHNIGLLIDLVPGNHRGYLCEPMTEM
jgi:hypothetical protein